MESASWLWTRCEPVQEVVQAGVDVNENIITLFDFAHARCLLCGPLSTTGCHTDLLITLRDVNLNCGESSQTLLVA